MPYNWFITVCDRTSYLFNVVNSYRYFTMCLHCTKKIQANDYVKRDELYSYVLVHWSSIRANSNSFRRSSGTVLNEIARSIKIDNHQSFIHFINGHLLLNVRYIVCTFFLVKFIPAVESIYFNCFKFHCLYILRSRRTAI